MGLSLSTLEPVTLLACNTGLLRPAIVLPRAHRIWQLVSAAAFKAAFGKGHVRGVPALFALAA